MKWFNIERILLVVLMFEICACKQIQPEETKSIPMFRQLSIQLDGQLQDWEKIPDCLSVSKFVSPWDKTNFGATLFNAVCDADWLYFSFKVTDSLLIVEPFTQKMDVALGDRVEIFLSGDQGLQNYYCLEMGPKGDILDYQASYYRKFRNDWQLNGFKIATSLFLGGYIVEGKIPLKFIRRLSKVRDEERIEFRMGLYRAEYNKKSTKQGAVQWLSWKDPMISTPDFHVPESFCKMNIILAN